MSKGYQEAVEADTVGEAAGTAAGKAAQRASDAVAWQNNERESARLAAAIDAYNAGHMLAENAIDPRQLEIIKQNVEAVRQAEWELLYAVTGGKLIKSAWGAFETWRAARAAAAATRVATQATPELSGAAQRAIRSIEARLIEPQSKLAAYKKNPLAFDNKGDLARNAARHGSAAEINRWQNSAFGGRDKELHEAA